jgi:hypothetical protein
MSYICKPNVMVSSQSVHFRCMDVLGTLDVASGELVIALERCAAWPALHRLFKKHRKPEDDTTNSLRISLASPER